MQAVTYSTTDSGIRLTMEDFKVEARANVISKIEVKVQGIDRLIIFKEPFSMNDLEQVISTFQQIEGVYYHCIGCTTEMQLCSHTKQCEMAHVVCTSCWKKLARCPFCALVYKGEGQAIYVSCYGSNVSNRRYGFRYASSPLHVYLKAESTLTQEENELVQADNDASAMILSRYNTFISSMVSPPQAAFSNTFANPILLDEETTDDEPERLVVEESMSAQSAISQEMNIPVPPIRNPYNTPPRRIRAIPTPRAPRANVRRSRVMQGVSSSSGQGPRVPNRRAMGRVYERTRDIAGQIWGTSYGSGEWHPESQEASIESPEVPEDAN